MIKLFVTGGAGYIGSEFVHQANSIGYDVVVFDNLEHGFKDNVPKGVKLVVGDLKDYKQIDDAIKNAKPDVVAHFAAYALVGESMRDPMKYFYNNIYGGLNLLQAMLNSNCRRIIFSSTCATYGIPSNFPITEDTAQNPINPYGQSKLMFEQILKTMSKLKDVKYTIFRYFNAAGADIQNNLHERHYPETHIIPNIINAIKGNTQFNLFGNDYNTEDGTCIRDYVHIKDIAAAHILAIQKDVCGEFNLGTNIGTSNKQLIDAICKISNKSVNVKYNNRRDGDPDMLISESKKAKDILGWNPINSDINTIIKDALNIQK